MTSYDIPVFSKEWFDLHQKKLLKFANSRLGRRLLRIHGERSSVGSQEIIRILPNAIEWQEDGVNKIEFRTHDKFAKRLYYGLKPLWFVLHGWDFVFGDVAKQLDFGFSTLTQYPGSIGANNPVDGFVKRSGVNESFATIRAGAGTTADTTTDVIFFARISATATTDQYSDLFRAYFDYDTSSLGSDATVSNVVFSLYGQGKDTALDGFWDVTNNTVTSTTALVTGDFGSTGTTSYGTFTGSTYTLNVYNDLTLNASGIGAISITSITKLATRLHTDLTNSAPTWIDSNDGFYKCTTSDHTGTSQDPKIVVTYSNVPADLSVNVSDSSAITESIGRTLVNNINVNDSSAITENVKIYEGIIQFDATSGSGYQAASADYTWSHTVGTGNNQILVVSVGLLSVVNSVTSITFNSVALTKLRSDVSVSGTVRTEIWYLLAPAQGAHTVEVMLTTASVSGATASSYNNVDQFNPADAQNGGTGITGAGGGSASISTTVITDQAVVVDAIATTDTSITVGSGQTQRGNITGAVGSSGQSDKGPIKPAAATTNQWDNIAALTTWTMSTLSLEPLGTDIDVSDTSAITENVQVVLVSNINVFDTSAITESVQETITISINVNDSSAVTENLKLLDILNINVTDSSAVSESTALAEAISVSVSDASTITETVQEALSIRVAVSDSSTITENLKMMEALLITVSDTSVITDSSMEVELEGLNVSDTSTITENVQILLGPAGGKVLNLSVTDPGPITITWILPAGGQ